MPPRAPTNVQRWVMGETTQRAIDEAVAGAAVGALIVMIVLAILHGRYDALGIAAVGAWLLTGLP